MNEDCATVVNIDDGFTFERARWATPPTINSHELVEAFEQLYAHPKKVANVPEGLKIQSVAQQYINFFNSLLHDH